MKPESEVELMMTSYPKSTEEREVISVQSSTIGKKLTCTLIFCICHSAVLEVGTKIEILNKDLLGEGKSERFYMDVGRIIGNFHFSNVPVMEMQIFFSGERISSAM